jgi:hypothetical protein
MYISNISSAGGTAVLVATHILFVGVTMRHEVWVEQEKVSQQFGKVVKHESAYLEDVTVTGMCRSPIGRGSVSMPGGYGRTADELITPVVCLPVDRSLNQQAVTI